MVYNNELKSENLFYIFNGYYRGKRMRPEVKNVVSKFYHLTRLEAGDSNTIEFSGIEQNPSIKYIWILSINNFLHMAGIYIFPSTSGNFEGLHSNILWTQEFDEDEPNTIPLSIKHEIKISEEESHIYKFENDEVAQSLSSMNIIPWLPAIMADGNENIKYEISVLTARGEAYARYSGVPQSKEQKYFVNAVKKKLLLFADLATDSKIINAINQLSFTDV